MVLKLDQKYFITDPIVFFFILTKKSDPKYNKTGPWYSLKKKNYLFFF